MHKKLKVLTLNVGLLDVEVLGVHVLEPAPYVSERLLKLPEALISAGADIVALQELYQQEHREYLIAQLQKEYPYHFYSRQQRLFRLENGLMLFSKYPFVSKRVVPFKENTVEEELVAFKGLMEGVIDIPEIGKVAIYNIHTTAGGARDQWDVSIERIRASQIEQVIHAIHGSKIPGIKIVVGDLNAGPEISASNYDLFLKNGFVDVYAHAVALSQHVMTWDPNNSLNKYGPHKNCIPQRIDHIFVRADDLHTVNVAEAKIVFDTPMVSLSDKRKVTVSDHCGLTAIFEK